MEKSEILRRFSADPDRYYTVDLFREKGFVRKSCERCRRYFWSMDQSRRLCPDDSPDTYSFIGSPPTSRRFDYTEAWRHVESFFTRNGHASIGRYPVVCRWRDDLFFTIASIVDFQRVMGSKVVFEFPANPLVVPQICLRFKDLENVGVTGRHFSSFCMVGQHAVPDTGGYWKDRCIELDYTMLTGEFGIPGEEITFVEDVWIGGGSFGSSLEYFVRGLELGNAVFTEFQGSLESHTTLDRRIIDMGAGLERLAWITMGTPTAYDCCFGPITGVLTGMAGIDPDPRITVPYFTEVARIFERTDDVRGAAARLAGLDPETVRRKIAPLEGVYLIADHLRTLIFAIADGALPSNVGGGYNLRVMLRRISGTASRLGLRLDIPELVDLHVDYLRKTYPELDARRDDIKTILGIEMSRYEESKSRMGRIAERIGKKGRQPTVDELITLYESDGVTPDYLREIGAISEVPSTFYTRLSELHQSGRESGTSGLPLDGLPATVELYYGDDPPEFDAQVLRVIGDMAVLDRTSFYARGGGQEPDLGEIDGVAVTDVQKHAGIILHRLEGGMPEAGRIVRCRVDRSRREAVTRHHTSTHIINASSRTVLGSWVWQHSAFKDEDHARLDITHHSSLTAEQVGAIEREANAMIEADLPVTIQYMDRGTAEQRYGFSIYQGGIVPVSSVRIVSIEGRDVEACGGTHVGRTGEIGLIRITRTKRIQDGVVRLEFVAGAAAEEHNRLAAALEEERKREERKRAAVLAEREMKRNTVLHDIPILLAGIASSPEPREFGASRTVRVVGTECVVEEPGSVPQDEGIERWRTATGWIYCTSDAGYGERFHVKLGRELVRAEGGSTYCGIFRSGPTIRVIVHAGRLVGEGRGADAIARAISETLGGSGGGNAEFAQGGGRDTSKVGAALARARTVAM